MDRLKRVFPILGWLPSYDRSDLRYDVVAGITVSALVIPKALGYAGVAQVPLAAGLYAAAAGAILYALFGTSRQISTGPSSALAAVAAGAVATTGLVGGDAAHLVAAITVTAGLGFVAFAVFRMGWISHFLSKPVITGFLFGAAIEVVRATEDVGYRGGWGQKLALSQATGKQVRRSGSSVYSQSEQRSRVWPTATSKQPLTRAHSRGMSLR